MKKEWERTINVYGILWKILGTIHKLCLNYIKVETFFEGGEIW